MRKPIQKQELEAFRRSLKPGDKIVYIEEAPRADGTGGFRKIKRVMEVEKVHRFTIDLIKGSTKRNITLQEAIINNTRSRYDAERQTGQIMELSLIHIWDGLGGIIEGGNAHSGHKAHGIHHKCI